MITKIKIGVISVVFLLLILSVFQQYTHLFKVQPLSGVTFEKKLNCTWGSFVSGTFQNELNDKIKGGYGFRPHFIRLTNQLNYWLFDELSTSVVRKGDNVLFEPSYVDCLSQDFIKDTSLFSKLEFINANSKIPVVVLLAPSKVRFFSELFTQNNENKISGYSVFEKSLSHAGINYIDYNKWFIHLRNTETNSLFSKTGVHWTLYGVTVASDTLIERLSNITNKKLVKPTIKELEYSQTARKTDGDLSGLLNLITPLEPGVLTYPKLTFEDGEKLNVLVVGDSFFITFYHAGVFQHVFSEQSSFLFYNRSVYNYEGGGNVPVANFPFDKIIENREVILLNYTEPNLVDFSNGFVGQYYHYLQKSIRN